MSLSHSRFDLRWLAGLANIDFSQTIILDSHTLTPSRLRKHGPKQEVPVLKNRKSNFLTSFTLFFPSCFCCDVFRCFFLGVADAVVYSTLTPTTPPPGQASLFWPLPFRFRWHTYNSRCLLGPLLFLYSHTKIFAFRRALLDPQLYFHSTHTLYFDVFLLFLYF